MEAVENPHSFGSNSKLAMRTDSRIASKFKPKVRIIHIFAPEIIKTDVANFRELVQRLTGLNHRRIKRKKTRVSPSKKLKTTGSDGYYGDVLMERAVQDDGEMVWGNDERYSSEFFNGFSDLNSFMDEFSLEHSATALSCSAKEFV